MCEHWCAQQELQGTFFRSLTLHQPQRFVEIIFICGTLKRTVMQFVTLTTPIHFRNFHSRLSGNANPSTPKNRPWTLVIKALQVERQFSTENKWTTQLQMKAFYIQADTRPGVVALQVTLTLFPCPTFSAGTGS